MQIKTVIRFILSTGILLLVVSIVNHWFNMVEAGERLEQAKQKVDTLTQQQQILQQNQQERNSPEYIEQQIRNKFNLVRPGEQLVILPESLQHKQSEDTIFHPLSDLSVQSTRPLPIWRQWWGLFF